MDGTFLNSYGDIPGENLRMVRKAMEMGVRFAIVTGRPYSSVKRLLKINKLKCAVIGCNGAQVTNDEGRLIRAHYINKASLLKVMRLAEDRNIYYQIYDDHNIYTKSIARAIRMIKNYSGKSVRKHLSFKTILGGLKRIFFTEIRLKKDIISYASDESRGFYKVQIASLSAEELTRLRNDLKDIPDIDITSSNYFNLEIGPKGVTKGTAVRELAESEGILQEEVIAMGDNLNDLPMIEYAGAGVAMENGDPRVKEKADFITKSNDNYGVAYAIEKFVFGKK